MKNNSFVYNGSTKAKIDDIPEEAWTTLFGEDRSKKTLYAETAWLYGVIQKRAGGVQQLPRLLTRLDSSDPLDERKDLPLRFDIPGMLYRSSIALDLYGAAYLRYEPNVAGSLVPNSSVRWLHPTSVMIDADKTGLNGFKRRVGDDVEYYEFDADTDRALGLSYVWLLGMSEIGPGEPPAAVAADAANVLHQIDKMAGSFFGRGAISAHFFTTETMPPKTIMDEIRARLGRLFFGGTSTAHNYEVFSSALTAQKIGSDPKDLEMSGLDADNRRDINTVFKTPEALLTGEAGGLSRSTLDRMTSNWIADAIAPQAQLIIDAWNRDFLNPAGYELSINTSAMGVDQEEEKERAQAFSLYVQSGVAPETAAAMLGLDVPDDMELLADIPAMPEPPPPDPPEMPDEQPQTPPEMPQIDDETRRAELGRLKRFVKRGRHVAREFKSDILTPDEIADVIASETEDDDVGDAFFWWYADHGQTNRLKGGPTPE